MALKLIKSLEKQVKKAVLSKYNWKTKGKRGSFVIQLRFYDEKFGEMFFDTKFLPTIDPWPEPGFVILQSVLGYRERMQPIDSSSKSMLLSVKPGTQLAMNIHWLGSRGSKLIKSLPITVKKMSKEKRDLVGLRYDERKPIKAKSRYSTSLEEREMINILAKVKAKKAAKKKQSLKDKKASKALKKDWDEATMREKAKFLAQNIWRAKKKKWEEREKPKTIKDVMVTLRAKKTKKKAKKTKAFVEIIAKLKRDGRQDLIDDLKPLMKAIAQEEPMNMFFDLTAALEPEVAFSDLISGAKTAKIPRQNVRLVEKYYHRPESVMAYKIKGLPFIAVKEDEGMYSIEAYSAAIRILKSRFNRIVKKHDLTSVPQISKGGANYLSIMIPSLEAIGSTEDLESKEMSEIISLYEEAIGEGWEDLPKGWTEESLRKFWNTLTGDRKHKIGACMKKMEGKVDNPGAFCGSLARRLGEV